MKHTRKITLRQIGWIVLILVVFVVLLKSLYTLYLRYTESTSDMRRAEASLQALSDREEDLRRHIDALDTDRGREQEIRSRFNVSKSGEELVVVVDENGTTTDAEPIQEKTWWQSITAFFFE